MLAPHGKRFGPASKREVFWGTESTARLANADTHHYTNSCPQVGTNGFFFSLQWCRGLTTAESSQARGDDGQIARSRKE